MTSTDIWQIVLTSVFTILGGLLVYTLGHLLVSFIIEPIIKLKNEIGAIANSLVYYANIICNPGCNSNKCNECSNVLRGHASQLRAIAHTIPFYSFWSARGLIASKKAIYGASKQLIGLSNSVFGGTGITAKMNHDTQKMILKILKI